MPDGVDVPVGTAVGVWVPDPGVSVRGVVVPEGGVVPDGVVVPWAVAVEGGGVRVPCVGVVALATPVGECAAVRVAAAVDVRAAVAVECGGAVGVAYPPCQAPAAPPRDAINRPTPIKTSAHPIAHAARRPRSHINMQGLLRRGTPQHQGGCGLYRAKQRIWFVGRVPSWRTRRWAGRGAAREPVRTLDRPIIPTIRPSVCQ